MISRNSFQLYLNISFHRTTKWMNHFLSIGINIYFVLNVIDIFISTNPSRSCSQLRKIFSIQIEIKVWRSHLIKLIRWCDIRCLSVSNLIKMIMDNLSQINNTSFLDLNLTSFIKFDSWSMNKSKISYIVLSSFIDNHELSLP